MAIVPVPVPGREYDIEISAGTLSRQASPGLAAIAAGRRALLITDSNVGPLYAAGVVAALQTAGAAEVRTITFPAGEAAKTLDTIRGFYDDAIAAGLDRSGLVIALGGGVCGDMAGFTAATWMRGVDYLQAPTSLLAQVDSSVGGKTGVDLPRGKNLVGAFHQPRFVLIDVETLRTLPPRELRCGLAEVVKYAVIMDADFFTLLESRVDALLAVDLDLYTRVIERCCRLKARVVLADERDLSGRRAILNYGHTFGHAIEMLAGFAGWTHGEAVALGMMMAAELACRHEPGAGLDALRDRQEALLAALGLPVRCRGFRPADILGAMRVDKKYVGGRNRLILPRRLGCCEQLADLPENLILDAIGARCDA